MYYNHFKVIYFYLHKHHENLESYDQTDGLHYEYMKNLNKELKFYMPVYYEKENDFTEEKYDFSNVIKVLRYLIIDLDMKIENLGSSWSDSKGIKKFNFLFMKTKIM